MTSPLIRWDESVERRQNRPTRLAGIGGPAHTQSLASSSNRCRSAPVGEHASGAVLKGLRPVLISPTGRTPCDRGQPWSRAHASGGSRAVETGGQAALVGWTEQVRSILSRQTPLFSVR